MKPKSTYKELLISQSLFIVLIAICSFILPTGWVSNHGISFYGVHRQTIYLYTAAFGLAALFLVRAAKTINVGYFKAAFYVMAALLIGMLITPYSLNKQANWLHHSFAIAFFCLELVLAVYLVMQYCWSISNAVCLSLLGLIGVVAAVYVPLSSGYLLEAQLIFQVIFTYIMCINFRRLESSQHSYAKIKTIDKG